VARSPTAYSWTPTATTAAETLSTKDDPVAGVLAGLERLAGTVGVDLPTLLKRTERIGQGTTIGTNAVLERNGARVGLVATAGHGDALAMMRGAGRVAGRSIEDVFSVHGSRLPAPLIVSGAVVEVHERVDASGEVVVALDVDAAAERIGRMIADYELGSVAIARARSTWRGPGASAAPSRASSWPWPWPGSSPGTSGTASASCASGGRPSPPATGATGWPARPRSPTAGCTPVTSAPSTRTATCGCSTGSRT
jgi:hypothetical protein